MSEFKTTNGALQFEPTDECLTLFSRIGSMRNASPNSIKKMFEEAFESNPELATQISYWARAAREGSGERSTFYTILDEIVKTSPDFVSDNAITLAELGYYKDLLRYFNIQGVVSAFAHSIQQKDRLACKWAPRKGENAKLLRDELGFTNKQYRVWIKENSETVEQQLSSKKIEEINYSSVPGTAMRKYMRTFNKKDEKRFQEWKEDKTTKASVSATYPHEILSIDDSDLADKMWDNLQDFMADSEENILPMIDVSGSMFGLPLTVALGLGMYLSERCKGSFKNKYLTFSESPELKRLVGDNVAERMGNISKDDWGMNTNFEKAYQLILDLAIQFKVPQDKMPTMLLVLSDMQFDESQRGMYSSDSQPHFSWMEEEFEKAGYKFPKLVFWNLNGDVPVGQPVMTEQSGAAMVSGFSPKIMTAVLNADEFNPMEVMLEALKPIELDYTNLNDKLDIEYVVEDYLEDDYGY